MNLDNILNGIPVKEVESAEEKVKRIYKINRSISSIWVTYKSNRSLPSYDLDAIEQAQKVIEEYLQLLKEEVKEKTVNHPAYKSRLKDGEILATYKRLQSFRAVAKALNCDPKTVKTRLEKMGYLKKRR